MSQSATPDPQGTRVPRALTALTALAALSLAPRPAAAQAPPPIPASNGDGFDLRLFRPAVDSRGQFSVNGTDVLGAWNVAFGLVVDYGRDLARIGRSPSGDGNEPLVQNMFSGTLLANVGLFNWAALGIQLPLHLVDGPGSTGLDASSYAPPAGGLSYQGAGDLLFNLKVRLLPASVTHFGLAVILQAGIPLGAGSRSFAGEPGFTLWPSLAFEWRPTRIFRLDVNAGYRHFFGRGSTLPQQSGGVSYAPPLTAGLGASLRVAPPVDLILEAYLANYTSAIGEPRAMPAEAVAGIKVFVQRNSYLMLGAGTRLPFGDAPGAANLRAFVGFVFEPSIGDSDGDGLRDDVDRCPSRPEDFDLFQDQDGCPEPDNDRDGILDAQDQCMNVPEDRDGDHDDDGCPERGEQDRDGDTILDTVDQCIDAPEDRDNFHDDDGCPDPDNDADSILDTDDLCPNEAEDRDNFEDANGCPDPDNDHDNIADVRDGCVNTPEDYDGDRDDDGCPEEGSIVLEDGGVRILEPIRFETNSARIRQVSMHIVEDVARMLQQHGEIRLIEVQGHADERGDDDHNLQLTRDRAASVVAALVDRGVASERLHSAGYGERCRAGYPAPTESSPVLNSECHGTAMPGWCHSERAWSRDRRVMFLILRTNNGPSRTRVVCDEAADLIPPEDREYHDTSGGD